MISLPQALALAVGPANVAAAGHAVADWFDGRNCPGAADLIREHLRDQSNQPAPDAVPRNRPDTSLRSELMAKLATQREVLLNLCDRVDRLEKRADGLTPIERVQRQWAKEAAGGDKLDRLIAQDRADEPTVPDGREPASVVEEPSDEELLYIAAQAIEPYDTIRLGEYEAGNGCAMEVYGSELIAFARAVLARQASQPAPPAAGEPSDENCWQWYTYCPEEGLEMYSDRKQAQSAAQSIMGSYEVAAHSDGWHEDMESVSWGMLVPVEQAQVVECKAAEPDDEFDEWVKYELRPARYAHQPAPPAEGEVGELAALIRQIALAWEPDACLLGNMTAGQLSRAAELLQQRHPEPVPEPPADALAARPLLEKVARLGDVIGQQTVAHVQQLAEQAALWLRDNPPGQPVAIEPRGCPTPGACTCVEPALPLPQQENPND